MEGHGDGCGCGVVPARETVADPPPGESAMLCSPCVARPSPLPERVAAIQAAITVATEPLVTMTHLLQLCRDEHRVLWESVNDPRCRAVAATITSEVRTVLSESAEAQVLNSEVRRRLARELTGRSDVPAVVVARVLVELLDDHFGPSLIESFRRRSPYQPGVGDPVPLDSADLRQVTALPATSPPWRLAHRLDETRHLRLAGEWAAQFQVIFDYSLAEHLTGLIGPDTVVATCHPNRTLADFDFPVDARGRTFPIRPAHKQRQHREIDRLIASAVAAGATIVVLPELCVTESIAAQLQDWTRRADGPRMLVAGSYHHADAHPARASDVGVDQPRRRNTAVGYLRGCELPLIHDKHSPADRPVHEDIEPQGWPQLRVYVSNDGWHLVIAICRDLLNPHAMHALAEAGVNVVFAPAMSETLVAFGGPVAQLVGSAQAFVAVANNPADFAGPAEATVRRPARALFGHPGFGQQTRLVQSPDAEPGMALLRVGTGQVQWLPSHRPAPQSRRGRAAIIPPWAAQLARRTGTQPRWPHQPVHRPSLQPAAVLVLLTDGPDGPEVVLTERASDLRHYPSQLVFPGGQAEPDDEDPVATALREAAEEIGLDASSVEVLGVLPAVAVPETGFLLTPVLAWSRQPLFTGSPNPAEVSFLVNLPVRVLPHPREGPHRLGRAVPGTPTHSEPGPLGVVTGLLIDLVRGMLAFDDQPQYAAAAEVEPCRNESETDRRGRHRGKS